MWWMIITSRGHRNIQEWKWNHGLLQGLVLSNCRFIMMQILNSNLTGLAQNKDRTLKGWCCGWNCVPSLKVLKSSSLASVSVTLWSGVFPGDQVYLCWFGRRKGLSFFFSGEFAGHSYKWGIRRHRISMVFRGSQTNSQASCRRAKGCCFGSEDDGVGRRRLVGG